MLLRGVRTDIVEYWHIIAPVSLLVLVSLLFLSGKHQYGEPIGYGHKGEDFGFAQVSVYKNGICRIEYGGVFGVDSYENCKCATRKGRLVIESNRDHLFIEELAIEVNQQTYFIQVVPKLNQ